MKTGKRVALWSVMLAVIGLTAGCSTTMLSASSVPLDDLYTSHNRSALAEAAAQRRVEAKAAAAANVERRQAELQQQILEAERAQQNQNPYDEILSDSYQESYERRLKGFESPTYKMPSSYYDYRYGDKSHYASAYDPAFYNVIVMGDEVWVEPKYITSMFGTWGTSSSVNINLNFGRSWWWGGYPSYYGGAWGHGYPYYGNHWGWGNPYYGGYWGNPYWGWGGGHHNHWGGGYYPKYNHSNSVFNKPLTGGVGRPSYSGGAGSNSGSSYRRIPSTSAGSASRPTTITPGGGSNASSSYRRVPSTSVPVYTNPGSSAGSSSGNSSSSSSTYRRVPSTSSSSSSSSDNNSGSSSGSSSTYRRQSSSSSSSSYSSGSSRSSGSSYSGGSSSGSSGGGGARRR